MTKAAEVRNLRPILYMVRQKCTKVWDFKFGDTVEQITLELERVKTAKDCMEVQICNVKS